MILNESQTKALQTLQDKSRNVALLGSAGVGKSTVVKQYLKTTKAKVVASTGVAAVLLGEEIKATTFNSFFGLGTMQESVETIVSNAINNPAVVNRIKSNNELVIDEISLISGKAFDIASYIARLIRKNQTDLPFGGIRIVVVGDFYQLAPVSKDNKKTDWIFNSYTWQECNFVCFELTEVMRTKDLAFLNILNKVKKGIVDREVSDFLNSKMIKKNESFLGTRLYSHKLKVQEYNQAELAKLTTPLHTFNAKFQGDPDSIARLKRNLPVEDPIILKVGAFVMTRINYRDIERGIEYVNGTTGFIESINPNLITIRTLEGRIVMVIKNTFNLFDAEGDVLASCETFALSLASAITIHKSQGTSLNSALIDISRGGKWASGLGYTALSRLTSPDGLRILSWNKSSFYVDPEVISFYNKIKATR